MADLSKGETITVFSVVVVVGVLIGAVFLTQPDGRNSRLDLEADLQKAQSSAPHRALRQIPYQVLRSHSVRDVVDTRWILIDRKNVNRADLLALGEQLQVETSGSKFAHVYIYDTKRAFDLRELAVIDRISAADAKHYDRHFIGGYARNPTTLHHQFVGYVNGLDAEPLLVKYDFGCCPRK